MAERGRLPDLVQWRWSAPVESSSRSLAGNGRLGRIIIVLFLAERGRLSQPLLYLSAYLEAYRREYYALLQRVRTHGEWLPWLLPRRRARDVGPGARAGAHADPPVRQVPGAGRREAERARGRAVRVAVHVGTGGAAHAACRRRAARRAVARLEDLGLLVPVPGASHPRLWVAPAILAAIEEPIETLVGDADEVPEGQPQKSWLRWTAGRVAGPTAS